MFQLTNMNDRKYEALLSYMQKGVYPKNHSKGEKGELRIVKPIGAINDTVYAIKSESNSESPTFAAWFRRKRRKALSLIKQLSLNVVHQSP